MRYPSTKQDRTRTNATLAAAMLAASTSLAADPDFDVDGDGIPESISVTIGFDPVDPLVGSVTIRSGATGVELARAEGHQANDFFGHVATPVGDTNDDGVPDFLVTAPLAPRTLGLGRAYVFSGDDGRLLSTISGLVSDVFGLEVELGGDADGDGRDDFLVSSWFVDHSLNVWQSWSAHLTDQNGMLAAMPRDSDAVLVREGADLDGNGVVDHHDMIELLLHFGEDNPVIDLDASGLIDEDDAVILSDEMADGSPDGPLGRYPWWEFMSAEDFAGWWEDRLGDDDSSGGQDGDGSQDDGGGGGDGDDGDDGDGGDGNDDDGGGGDSGDDDDYDGDEPEDNQEEEPCEFFDPDDTWERADDCFVVIGGPCGEYTGLSPPESRHIMYVAFGWPLHGEYEWSVDGADDVIVDGNVCVAKVSQGGTLNATVTYARNGCQATASCESRVVVVDVDIDSDNDNAFGRPDRSEEEETLEDEPNDDEKPG